MRRILPLVLALGLLRSLSAQETPVALQLEQVATGLTSITYMTHCGDDRLFLVLRGGTIRIMNPDNSVLTTPFLNITSRVLSTQNEQGLLSMAFDPDYATNGYFYVYYINGSSAGTSSISRFSVTSDPNVADPNSEVILYTKTQPYWNHNGGNLRFGPDGYLYCGFGDGGSGNDPQGNAQNMANVLGKMIRIDVSGGSGWTVPADNPFAGANPADTLPEIFASGLRNPWRYSFDAVTGDLWIGDVGQNTWEEVDFWPAGDLSGPNFGWKCREGLVDCPSCSGLAGCPAASAFVSPVSVHQNAVAGGQWCAMIGGQVYRGSAYPRLYGRYLYTDYCAGTFQSLVPDGAGGFTRTQLLASGLTGWSCIGENSAHELYASTHDNGRLYKLKEVCPVPAPTISGDAAGLASTDALAYQWYLDGTPLANATSQTLVPAVPGVYSVLATTQAGCQLFSNAIAIIATGLAESAQGGITVRPVPANEAIHVDGVRESGTTATLFDAQGRMVLQRSFAQAGTLTLAAEALRDGFYSLRLMGADGSLLLQRAVTVQH